jgi:pumilio family protein 6
MQEFYGPESTIFKESGNQRTLTELLELHPSKKKSMLKHLRSTLMYGARFSTKFTLEECH